MKKLLLVTFLFITPLRLFANHLMNYVICIGYVTENLNKKQLPAEVNHLFTGSRFNGDSLNPDLQKQLRIVVRGCKQKYYLSMIIVLSQFDREAFAMVVQELGKRSDKDELKKLSYDFPVFSGNQISWQKIGIETYLRTYGPVDNPKSEAK